jgi:hypothetical protein
MKRFVIVEVGSTTTKSYLYENGNIDEISLVVIPFKEDYKKDNKINDKNKQLLFEYINNIKEENIFVYGTSIFRNITEEELNEWNKEFKDNTGFDFTVVTPDMENEYTVYGVISNIDYKGKLAVMIGGGGSTELSIVEDGKIIERANSSFGAIDIIESYPDLKEDKVKTDYDLMINETKKLVNTPTNKADLLVLAGGNYTYFYEELGFPIQKNKFYYDKLQPYCIDRESMDLFDRKFFYEMSLDEIGKRTNRDSWWRGTRGMRICVETLVQVLDVKYTIPTKISMVYGIAETLKDK